MGAQCLGAGGDKAFHPLLDLGVGEAVGAGELGGTCLALNDVFCSSEDLLVKATIELILFPAFAGDALS